MIYILTIETIAKNNFNTILRRLNKIIFKCPQSCNFLERNIYSCNY
ncbi:hypothetical protein pb186bvf_016643 [Paramecium bursaria]